jgi:hypothetical protein
MNIIKKGKKEAIRGKSRAKEREGLSSSRACPQ